MKKNVLYIGNNLKYKTSNTSSIASLGKLLENEGCELYYASSKINKLLRILDMFWSCIKHRKNINYVLIDTYSTLNFYYAYFVSQLCRVLKLKYIPILHGGNLPLRLEKNPKLSQSIFSYAYKNIAPSKYIEEKFKAYGYQNITLIPNSIIIDNYSFKQRSVNTIKLLWVRSFSKIYNPELAVNALKVLQDKGFDANLCMVGPDSDGSLKTVKKLAKKLNIEVEFTGKLSKEEWVNRSKNFNVFINTTNFDNMPVSVIEAMALGLPVVSTNVGGIPYLIEDGVDGLLIKSNNINAMADAIIKLKNDKELANKITSNARKKVEQYDWDIVKHLWFKLLN